MAELYEIILELEELKDKDITGFWEKIKYYKLNMPLVFEELKPHFPEITSAAQPVLPKKKKEGYPWLIPVTVGMLLIFIFFLYFRFPAPEEVVEEKPVPKFDISVYCDSSAQKITVEVSSYADYNVTSAALKIISTDFQEFYNSAFLEPLAKGKEETLVFSAPFLVRRTTYGYELVVGQEVFRGSCST